MDKRAYNTTKDICKTYLDQEYPVELEDFNRRFEDVVFEIEETLEEFQDCDQVDIRQHGIGLIESGADGLVLASLVFPVMQFVTRALGQATAKTIKEVLTSEEITALLEKEEKG